jgi:hypothetical protein
VAVRDVADEASVHFSEALSGRHLIQTPFKEFEGDGIETVASDKDFAKLRRRAEKEERSARAALASHQVSIPTRPHLPLWRRRPVGARSAVVLGWGDG